MDTDNSTVHLDIYIYPRNIQKKIYVFKSMVLDIFSKYQNYISDLTNFPCHHILSFSNSSEVVSCKLPATFASLLSPPVISLDSFTLSNEAASFL